MLERKDLDLFVSCADELVWGFESSVGSILIPLIERGMYAKWKSMEDPQFHARRNELGYDPIHEPELLGKWKFIYNAIFDHARKYNRILKVYESTSVKQALEWKYRQLRAGRDEVAIREALERAQAQYLHFDSEVEEIVGIPATYRYEDATGEEHEVIGFYELVDRVCDAGEKRVAKYLPADWAMEVTAKYREMRKEALA